MPNFFFLLKPNHRFTGTFSWINPYRRPFFLIKVVRQSVRGFIRNMSWKRHRLARRRIIAESRPMYAELPVCRARAWALCYASSLPPGATSDKTLGCYRECAGKKVVRCVRVAPCALPIAWLERSAWLWRLDASQRVLRWGATGVLGGLRVGESLRALQG